MLVRYLTSIVLKVNEHILNLLYRHKYTVIALKIEYDCNDSLVLETFSWFTGF